MCQRLMLLGVKELTFRLLWIFLDYILRHSCGFPASVWIDCLKLADGGSSGRPPQSAQARLVARGQKYLVAYSGQYLAPEAVIRSI